MVLLLSTIFYIETPLCVIYNNTLTLILTHHSHPHPHPHLFFTQIPHYHLPKATKALKTYLEDNGLGMYHNNRHNYMHTPYTD
jgi:hypothetical protein